MIVQYIYAQTAQPYLTDVLNMITQIKTDFGMFQAHTIHIRTFMQCLSQLDTMTSEMFFYCKNRIIHCHLGCWSSCNLESTVPEATSTILRPYLSIPFRISEIIIKITFFFAIIQNPLHRIFAFACHEFSAFPYFTSFILDFTPESLPEAIFI